MECGMEFALFIPGLEGVIIVWVCHKAICPLTIHISGTGLISGKANVDGVDSLMVLHPLWPKLIEIHIDVVLGGFMAAVNEECLPNFMLGA
jgi:hypothetical protein